MVIINVKILVVLFDGIIIKWYIFMFEGEVSIVFFIIENILRIES